MTIIVLPAAHHDDDRPEGVKKRSMEPTAGTNGEMKHRMLKMVAAAKMKAMITMRRLPALVNPWVQPGRSLFGPGGKRSMTPSS